MPPLRAEIRSLAPEPSHHDIAALAKRFVEPLRGENPPAPSRPALPKPTLVPRAVGVPGSQAELSPAELPDPGEVQGKGSPTRNAWVCVLVVLALVPLAMLFVRLWQDNVTPHAANAVASTAGVSASSSPAVTVTPQPPQPPSKLEVALSSPDKIEAKAGEVIEFPMAIDATEALPARSIVAVTALPEGASFSEGRPYGVTGWSLGPDEIGDLQLHLPARSGSTDMRLELVAGDGTVLAQSETELSIVASPAEATPVAATPTNPLEQAASAAATGSVESSPPPPRQPAASAEATPGVKVNTVKVVTIPAPETTPAQQPAPAPKLARPYDGGYGLGPAPEEPQAQAEWLVTKAPVDMHAKAGQHSATVKVADKGLKLKVVAREKDWVEVTDPKTSTTGWIYNRFLKPAEPVAQ